MSSVLPMVADFSTASAERIGAAIGPIFAVISMLAVSGFAVFAVVQAIRKRTLGWIIAGVGGAFVVLLAAAVLAAGVLPSPQAQVGGEAARTKWAPKVPVTAASEMLTGTVVPFKIEKPAGWWVKRSQGVYDVLMSNDAAFIGVIAEKTDLGDATSVATLARERIDASATEVTMSGNETVRFQGRDWVAFTAKCKVQDMPFAYQYYVYSGKEGTIQILGWMYQQYWDRDAGTIRKAMQTLRLPAVDSKP